MNLFLHKQTDLVKKYRSHFIKQPNVLIGGGKEVRIQLHREKSTLIYFFKIKTKNKIQSFDGPKPNPESLKPVAPNR